MEHYWTSLLNNNNSNISSTSSSNTSVQGHNGNSTHASWTWNLIGSSTSTTLTNSASAFHALMLGKRQYFEEDLTTERRHVQGRSSPAAPRCQVEGCEVVLGINNNAIKEYHRRRKVCEVHAKAPRVVVLGIQQRFCQQCSRFHGVEEFDESKRSCRRRLAGHNERRRKSSQDMNYSLIPRKLSQGKLLSSSSECAFSLLSSTNSYPFNISSPSSEDLPARCSAALRELIEENRASNLACRHNNTNRVGDFNGGSNHQ